VENALLIGAVLSFMKYFPIILLVLLLLMPVAGSYHLERFLIMADFICEAMGGRSIGGVFDGHLLQIGANQDIIIAFVNHLYRYDPDVWYVLEAKTGKIYGLLTEPERGCVCNWNGIACEPVGALWARKKGVQWYLFNNNPGGPACLKAPRELVRVLLLVRWI
jgi:hypothetical protein